MFEKIKEKFIIIWKFYKIILILYLTVIHGMPLKKSNAELSSLTGEDLAD